MTELDTSKKYRAYAFTINNYSDLEKTAVLETECRYLCVAPEECPTTGTPHLQGYFYFENPKSFKALKERFPRANFRSANGTAQQNRTYIFGPYNKDGKFKPANPLAEERGIMPSQGKRNDIQEVREQIQQGQGMRQIIETATSYQSIRSAEMMLKYKEKVRNWKTEVIWVYGKSGTGKTRWAYDRYPSEDIHLQNVAEPKWFDGYDAHPVVILDEVDGNVSYPLLKQLTDRYPMKVHNKGGMRSFLAKIIVITSLYHPEVLFMNYPENGYEMLRRIDKIIELPE